MAILQGVWKQHLRPRAVVGYGVKILLPSPPNYVTRSPGYGEKLAGFSLAYSCFAGYDHFREKVAKREVEDQVGKTEERSAE